LSSFYFNNNKYDNIIDNDYDIPSGVVTVVVVVEAGGGGGVVGSVLIGALGLVLVTLALIPIALPIRLPGRICFLIGSRYKY